MEAHCSSTATPVTTVNHVEERLYAPPPPLGVYCALCEELAVLHHREFGKFRRLKGRH